MIKIVLKGGLGNQMFQYATGLAVATKLNTNLYLDLSYLLMRPPIPGFTIRDYELDFFGISQQTGTLLNNPFLNKYFTYIYTRFYHSFILRKHYNDIDPYFYNELVFKNLDGTLLEGYFNNYKYFESISDEIKKTFDLDKFYTSAYSEIEQKIASCNSVSVNIRRGDYTNAKHKGVFTFLDENNYYLKAIACIKEKVENPHFFIFSYDEPEWFKRTLKLKDNEFTFLGKEYVGDHFKTYLRLISLCKHNIISNSTFAFWGAYLNKNSDKVVVTPKKWSYIWSDFEAPKEWVLINNEKN